MSGVSEAGSTSGSGSPEAARRFQGWRYHARGVPGFGDPVARLWIIGLAPAAHGANRTGRMFTGDRSGQWLYQVLYEVGLSSAPESLGLSDGLQLYGVYISAVVRCAPPANKPLSDEIHTCRAYLLREWHALRPHLRVVLALGAIAHQAAVEVLGFHRAAALSAWCLTRITHRREASFQLSSQPAKYFHGTTHLGHVAGGFCGGEGPYGMRSF